MLAPDSHCKGATTDRGDYRSDRNGMLNVESAKDIKNLKDAGFLVAGATPATSRYWLCKCGWRALFNSCPKCQSTNLVRMEE